MSTRPIYQIELSPCSTPGPRVGGDGKDVGLRLERDPSARKDPVFINYREAGGGEAGFREVGQGRERLPAVARRLDARQIRRDGVAAPGHDEAWGGVM